MFLLFFNSGRCRRLEMSCCFILQRSCCKRPVSVEVVDRQLPLAPGPGLHGSSIRSWLAVGWKNSSLTFTRCIYSALMSFQHRHVFSSIWIEVYKTGSCLLSLHLRNFIDAFIRFSQATDCMCILDVSFVLSSALDPDLKKTCKNDVQCRSHGCTKTIMTREGCVSHENVLISMWTFPQSGNITLLHAYC